MDGEWFSFSPEHIGSDWFNDDPLESSQDQRLVEIQELILAMSAVPQIIQETEQPKPRETREFGLRSERSRTVFSAAAQREMEKWMTTNADHPFPTQEIEDRFILKYGMTRKQVKTAFNNRRQRLIPALRLKWQAQSKESSATFFPASGLKAGSENIPSFFEER
jgi:hypothetical protein